MYKLPMATKPLLCSESCLDCSCFLDMSSSQLFLQRICDLVHIWSVRLAWIPWKQQSIEICRQQHIVEWKTLLHNSFFYQTECLHIVEKQLFIKVFVVEVEGSALGHLYFTFFFCLHGPLLPNAVFAYCMEEAFLQVNIQKPIWYYVLGVKF